MDDSIAPRVLVTGASGFIASHIIAALLSLGYRVRGTVRSLAKAPTFLANLVPESQHKLELVEADLVQAECWLAAVSGCDFVLHVASPFTFNVADAEASLTRPAVEGTLNVLRAVAACPAALRPRRVVLTSSLSSVAYGRPLPPGHVFTEADWSDPDSTAFGMGSYQRSKTLAERAAWQFVRGLPPGDAFELCAVCPGSVFGPLLGKQASGRRRVGRPRSSVVIRRPLLPTCALAGQHGRGVGVEAAQRRAAPHLRPAHRAAPRRRARRRARPRPRHDGPRRPGPPLPSLAHGAALR